VAPGGFNPAFDLIEINAAAPADDAKVLQNRVEFLECRTSLLPDSGYGYSRCLARRVRSVRAFAHIEGQVTAKAFAQALKEGHGYVTFGPLVFPSVVFGDELKVKPGQPFSC
jgi:hypothetical protein